MEDQEIIKRIEQVQKNLDSAVVSLKKEIDQVAAAVHVVRGEVADAETRRVRRDAYSD